jgi:hypothetical protein
MRPFSTTPTARPTIVGFSAIRFSRASSAA